MIPKFRAWDKQLNKMFIPSYLATDSEGQVNGVEDQSLENIVLMQSTGLKDKNGVEIFESDIVIGDYTTKDVKQGHIVKYEKIYHEMGVAMGFDGLSKNVEIIGNIYSNPELLG